MLFILLCIHAAPRNGDIIQSTNPKTPQKTKKEEEEEAEEEKSAGSVFINGEL